MSSAHLLLGLKKQLFAFETGPGGAGCGYALFFSAVFPIEITYKFAQPVGFVLSSDNRGQ